MEAGPGIPNQADMQKLEKRKDGIKACMQKEAPLTDKRRPMLKKRKDRPML